MGDQVSKFPDASCSVCSSPCCDMQGHRIRSLYKRGLFGRKGVATREVEVRVPQINENMVLQTSIDIEKEEAWVTANSNLLEILSHTPKTAYEAYKVMEMLTETNFERYDIPDAYEVEKVIQDYIMKPMMNGPDKFVASAAFAAKREGAFDNLSACGGLILKDKIFGMIPVIKEDIAKRGIEVSALRSLGLSKDEVALMERLQATPRTRKEANKALGKVDHKNLFRYLSEKYLVNESKGAWILVKLGCYNGIKANDIIETGN
jgi:hypothetical protein